MGALLAAALAASVVGGPGDNSLSPDSATETSEPEMSGPLSHSVTSRTADLALGFAPQFIVSGVATTHRRQVLWVDYSPTPTTRYAGGTISLYQIGAFRRVPFLGTATELRVGALHAYFGVYGHQFSLAWLASKDRWVCVSGFLGSGNGTDPSVSLKIERAVARGVVVR